MPQMGEKGRLKIGHARVETRVLKTLARRNVLGLLESKGRDRVGAF